MIDQRIALVTGGSRGIGRATCLALAEAGVGVMVNFNENIGAAQETCSAVEELGVPADICQADISAKSHRDLLVGYTMEKFGRIDLLVNNAGIAPQVRQDILETDDESFDRILDMNLKAPYFLTQRVAREMIQLIENGSLQRADIVNISSIRSYTTARNYGEYCISKAGVGMITRLFAARLAEHRINVYEICPGIIETDMTSGDSVRDYYNGIMAKGMAPINRWGKPEEVGAAIASIAHGHFPFSTGMVIAVDGGWHLREL